MVQRPDSLSGLIDSQQAPVAHHNKSTSDYSFEDWIALTSASANLWSFNSVHSSTALLGAVMDTGAQRGATGARTEILQKTGHTLTMQPAIAPSKRMTGIVMGTETVDQHGVPYVLVIPDVSVFDPGMSDSLVSAGRLMEADYGVIFRIPSNADSDGFPSAQFSLYGGSVTTPDGSTVIVMEYVNHTWRLPNVGSPVVSMTLPQKYSSSSLISAEDLSDIVITSNIATCDSF